MNKIDIEILIQKHLIGTTTPAEEATLAGLLQSDAAIRAMLEQESSRLPRHLRNTITDHKVTEQTARIHTHIDATTSKRRIRARLLSFAAAAAVLLGVVAVFFLNSHKPGISKIPVIAANDVTISHQDIQLTLPEGRRINLSDTANRQIALAGSQLSNDTKTLAIPTTASGTEKATLTVPVGKDYHLQLPDGSTIFLNSQTSITFPLSFQGNTREISVDGEAYIQVAPHPGQPFIVHTPAGGNIEVLGTAFNVNTYKTGTTAISLVSGKVRANYAKSTTLTPGQQLIASGPAQDVQAFDSTEVLAWMKGILLFDNVELQDIATVLPRWYGIKVVIDNPAAGRKHFTGQVNRNRPVEEFLQAMKETASVDYQIDAGIVHFK